MQIPKLIHYFYDDVNIWETGKNPQVRMCMCSWKKVCPEYGLMLWHDKHPEFREILKQSFFVRKAYELGLWAFVSDYVRLYALYKYGGIYLDTDVQLLQNFDRFLNDGFFISVESEIKAGENLPEPAVMGSVAGHPLLKEAMELYRSRQIFEEKRPIADVIMKKALRRMTGFSRIPYETLEATFKSENFYMNNLRIDDFDLYCRQRCQRYEEQKISIYPSEYFCPSWCVFQDKAITGRTVAVHWRQNSWGDIDAVKKLREAVNPAPLPQSVRRQFDFRLCKIPLLKIVKTSKKTKVSFLRMLKVRISKRHFKIRLFGFISLLKIVRKN